MLYEREKNMLYCNVNTTPEEEAKENFVATVLRELESDNINLEEALSNEDISDSVYDKITETMEKKNTLIIDLIITLYDTNADKAKELSDKWFTIQT